ncbi:hypothetical protein SARC_09073 [Sphaeroforma arctica JP610]|uniref:Uncharacterized protein n=1 Tax=Sphaeroforma arctica JP610 TaxID=667725 RepID=A0A0L0FR71_9EUKA|nr:hypothetical protein SARC_09073 [Sphaeroforma arctica JP610]KNC78498.1 hypothetical protein SARC_09073 [Sphaeroforma arctica JP610]|eukprot:XP_014152400.1 hypothetical protein SARC_09073 [Sphaeroforma arctica JP610]
MCVVLIGVIVYVFLYAVYKLFVYPYYLCEFLEMPGPPNSPGWRGWIMGNVPQIADSPPVVPLIKWREQYGANVSRFDNYRRPVRVDRFLKNILGEGLLTVWGLICFNELASCNEFKQHMHRPLLL